MLRWELRLGSRPFTASTDAIKRAIEALDELGRQAQIAWERTAREALLGHGPTVLLAERLEERRLLREIAHITQIPERVLIRDHPAPGPRQPREADHLPAPGWAAYVAADRRARGEP